MPRPIVFYTGNTVAAPGDTVCIRGEDLEGLRDATLSDGRRTQPVVLQQLCAQSFKFTVPETFSPGAFAFSAQSEAGKAEFLLNAPVVRWLQGDEGEGATGGGWLRLNGECMRVTEGAPPSLTLRLPDGEKALAPERVYDDYSVGFAMPALAPGAYPARYCNGFTQTDVTVKIVRAAEEEWPAAVYDAAAEGVPTDGHSDCTDALRALFSRVEAAGGGVVRFPKGRFHLTGCLRIPRRCVIRGEGYRRTQLFWTDEWQRKLPAEDGWPHWEPLPLPEAKPDVIMLNEGSDPAHLAAGFDIDYGTTYCDPLRWLARGDITAKWLTDHFREVDARTPPDKLGWRGLENHDFVNDAMEHRLERDIGAPLMECALALNFTGRGVPYLYCGHEFGDTTRHSILGNRFCAPNLRVNWSFAQTEAGQARMALIRALAALRHELPVFSAGEVVYPAHAREDAVIVFCRADKRERASVWR